MARNRSNRLLKGMRANVRATERTLAKDRMADYRAAMDVNEAIFRNLFGYQARVGRRLTTQNKRLLEMMGRVVANQRMGARDLRRSLHAAGAGIMADAVAAAGAPAGAELRAGTQVTKAQQRLGRGLARTGSLVMQLAETGAREAEASAQAALAQALQARTQEDVQMVAQMRHDAYMAQLQHQLALEQMEKEFEIAKKRFIFEQKAATGQLGNQGEVISSLADKLGTVSVDMRNYLMENPEATWPEVQQHLVNTGAVTEAELQHPAYAALFNALRRGQIGRGPGMLQPTVDAILVVLRQIWPDYARYDRIRQLVENSIRYHAALEARTAPPASPASRPEGAIGVSDGDGIYYDINRVVVVPNKPDTAVGPRGGS